jgi:regulator of protease activity HflC (stomatin/prohibitin superfamily)
MARDNVSVKVNAVVYLRVIDPQKAIIQVEDHLAATSQLGQITLRSVLGQHGLDEVLAERDKLNDDVWRILDESMIRATDRQGKAERARRAKTIHAEGGMQAAEKLTDEPRILAAPPQAIQLRHLENLTSVAGDKTSTIVFPMPIDLLAPLLKLDKGSILKTTGPA